MPLTAIEGPGGIVPAIAEALNHPLTGTEPVEDQLKRLLRGRKLLLVLDNFEHLVAGGPMLVGWLAAAPGLKLMITSRERLNLAEEWLYHVDGFSPDQAIAFFSQAAQRMDPRRYLVGQSQAVAEICRLADGLLLALELAASLTRVMSCHQIVEQMERDFRFLVAGPRNAPERHRNLSTLFDHSWQLLNAEEQRALAWFSTFRAGCSAEEAAAVTSAGWPILLGLVDKSLVMFQANGRYDTHQLTRQYAAAKVCEMRQEPAARQKHFDVYRSLAELLDSHLHGPEGITAFARMDQEQDNFRAAMRWGLETKQTIPVLDLVKYLSFYWLRRGYWRVGEGWFAEVISQAGEEENASLSLALIQRTILNGLQGHYSDASRFLSRGLEMARHLNETETLAAALMTFSNATPDYKEALGAMDEVIILTQRDEKLKWRLAFIHMLYGDRLRNHSDNDKAESHYQESLRLMQEMGDVDMVAYPLGNLGLLALLRGQLAEAEHLISESVAISRATGNQVGIADWIFQLGLVLLYLGRTEEAVGSLHEALTRYEEMNDLRGQAVVTACLAQSALEKGDVEQSDQMIRKSLSTTQTLHNQIQPSISIITSSESGPVPFTPDEMDSLLRVAFIQSEQKHYGQAATLLGAAHALTLQGGYQPAPPLQASVNRAIEVMQDYLSEGEFKTSWNEGLVMLSDQILAFDLQP